jgi:hypothetical protein
MNLRELEGRVFPQQCGEFGNPIRAPHRLTGLPHPVPSLNLNGLPSPYRSPAQLLRPLPIRFPLRSSRPAPPIAATRKPYPLSCRPTPPPTPQASLAIFCSSASHRTNTRRGPSPSAHVCRRSGPAHRQEPEAWWRRKLPQMYVPPALPFSHT